MNDRTKGMIAAFFNYAFIGLSFLFTKIAVSLAPTFVVLSFRFIFALLILSVILIFQKKMKKIYGSFKKDGKNIVLYSILQPILFFTFQALALARIDSIEFGLVASLAPGLVAIMGIIFLDEQLIPLKKIGLISTLGGLIFIYFLKGAFTHEIDFLGIIYAVIATIAGAAYQVMGRNLSQDHDPLTLAFIRVLIGTIIFSVLALGFNNWKIYAISNIADPLKFFFSISFLVLFTTVGTSLLTVYSLKRLLAAEQSTFAGIATVISFFAGIIFLSEEFPWINYIGVIFVFAGVFLMNKSKISAKNHEKWRNDIKNDVEFYGKNEKNIN